MKMGYNYKMFPVQSTCPQTQPTPKISVIKAKIDNKISTLFLLLNKMNMIEKNDQMCQTEFDLDEKPAEELNLALKRENSISQTKYYPRSYQSTEVRSNSSNTNRFFSRTSSRDEKDRSSVIIENYNKRNLNKSLDYDLTPKKQKRQPKINTKNHDFEKILKQRKRKGEIKRKERQKNPVPIKSELLRKMELGIRERSEIERYESQQGQAGRKKLILKLSDQYFPLL